MHSKKRVWLWAVAIAVLLSGYSYYMVRLHQKALTAEQQKREQRQLSVRASATPMDEQDALLKRANANPAALLPADRPLPSGKVISVGSQPSSADKSTEEVMLSLDKPADPVPSIANAEALKETQRVVDGFSSLRNPELSNTNSEYYQKMHNGMSELLIRQMNNPPSPKLPAASKNN